MARFVLPVAAALLAIFHVTMSITVQEFFKVNSNLTQIKWAHAVNNQSALNQALNSTTIHMIEADVNMGKLVNSTNTTDPIPVMHHDSDNVTSDLSLQSFLTQVIGNKTKGIKLDFKTQTALQEGLKVLMNTANKDTVPVWLNADILKGPGAADTPNVDSKRFFDLVKSLNNTLLSIGWTTKIGQSGKTQDSYTKEHVEEMQKLVKGNNVTQSVTYPVRAAIAANNITFVQSLVTGANATDKATLTIWSHEGDVVNTTELNKLIKNVGLEKLYIDVPANLSAQLDLNGAFTVKSSLTVMLASLLAAVFAVNVL